LQIALVVDLPAAVAGASFYGTIVDAWQVPLVDTASKDVDHTSMKVNVGIERRAERA
jgi:hypothetical protein